MVVEATVNSESLQLPFGGEIWEQREFPCFVCYIVTGRFGMGKSSDPRLEGNCTDIKEGGWSQEDMAKHLYELGYVCVGRLYDLILGPEHLKELVHFGRDDPGRGNRWRETH